MRAKMEIQGNRINELLVKIEEANEVKNKIEEDRQKVQLSYDWLASKYEDREGQI